MKIHLKHPKHGEKVAYYEAEAELDKKNGWVQVDLTPVGIKPVGEVHEFDKPKRGRPRKEG